MRILSKMILNIVFCTIVRTIARRTSQPLWLEVRRKAGGRDRDRDRIACLCRVTANGSYSMASGCSSAIYVPAHSTLCTVAPFVWTRQWTVCAIGCTGTSEPASAFLRWTPLRPSTKTLRPAWQKCPFQLSCLRRPAPCSRRCRRPRPAPLLHLQFPATRNRDRSPHLGTQHSILSTW